MYLVAQIWETDVPEHELHRYNTVTWPLPRTMAKDVPSAPSGQSMSIMFTSGRKCMAMMKSPSTSSPAL